MAHLRVIPVLVNGVTEEEALLNGGSQIVSITRDMAAANKISWGSETHPTREVRQYLSSRVHCSET